MRMPLPRRIKYLERLFLSAMRVVGKIEITQLAPTASEVMCLMAGDSAPSKKFR
jgi:hypothetical protein